MSTPAKVALVTGGGCGVGKAIALALAEEGLDVAVSATMISGGYQVNVIPSEITVELDGCLLPGFTPDDMLAELRTILGNEVELEVVIYEEGPPAPDMGLFDTLVDVLHCFGE